MIAGQADELEFLHVRQVQARPTDQRLQARVDACRWELVESFDEIFGTSGTGDISKYGLVSMMLDVAEKGALGDFTTVENHYVKTVLIQMDETIRKAKEHERLSKT